MARLPAVLWWLTVAFIPALARAQAPSQCRTISARATDEIVRPLRTPEMPALPEHAVEVQAGETICVSGVLRGGELEGLELREESAAGEPGLELALTHLPDGTGSMLAIKNRTDRWLRYRALIPFGATGYLGGGGRVHPVGPAQTNFEVWPAKLDRVVLFEFEVAQPPATDARPERPPSNASRRVAREGTVLGIGLPIFFGVRPLDLDELDREFSRNGYSTTDSTAVMGGFGIWATVQRFRFELNLFGGGAGLARHDATGRETSPSVFQVGVDVGYELFERELFSIYPSIGIYAAGLSLDIPRGAPPPILPGELGGLDVTRTVEASNGLASFSLAIEQAFLPFYDSPKEFFAFTIGARLGYFAELGESDWAFAADEGGDDLAGGPNVDLGGAYFLLGVGVGGRVPRSR